MALDIADLSRRELESLKKKIEKKLEKLDTDAKKAALEAARKAAQQHGFKLQELVGAEPAPKAPRKPRATRKMKGVAKYANPDDKSQTWTGKGRQPAWFKAAIAAGKKPEDMAI